MLRGVVAVATISVSAACTPGHGPADAGRPAAPEAPWVTLFDGTSLAAWTMTGDANWQLADGVVAADMGAGFLVTRESYGDFDLEAEFFVSPDANSGVFLRCANPAKPGAATCYEVNIFDQRKDKTMFIIGAGTLRYRDIVEVIDAARGAGVEKVGIVTEGMRKAAGAAPGI